MMTRAVLGVSFAGGVGLLLLVVKAAVASWAWNDAPQGPELLSGRYDTASERAMPEGISTRNIVFLHRSVGANLIGQGHLRSLLTARGYEFYDQGYNEYGLTLPSGEPAGFGYMIPDDNTDPDGLAAIFQTPVDPRSVSGTGQPTNTVSGLLRHDVIMFKSCFPVNGIASDAQLETYKGHYRAIRTFAQAHPDHLFIVLSPPPLEPKSTNRAEAARARAFANWLKSPEFIGGQPNLAAIDLFDLLAESDTTRPDYSMLHVAYQPGADSNRPKAFLKRMVNFGFETIGVERRLGGGDSHPNYRANQRVAPIVADAVHQAVDAFRATAKRPVGSTF